MAPQKPIETREWFCRYSGGREASRVILGHLRAFERYHGRVEPETPKQYPLTPLECAHNLLASRGIFRDEASYRKFLDMAFSRREPYIDLVREMVYAELPFWELLDEYPPCIPLPDKK